MNNSRTVMEVLNEDGFETVDGADAVLAAIKDAAVPGPKLCSRFGIFPGGEKCQGCDDCKMKKEAKGND
jgi:hypothetical protein